MLMVQNLLQNLNNFYKLCSYLVFVIHLILKGKQI